MKRVHFQVSYQYQIGNQFDGFGSMTYAMLLPWRKGYTQDNLHDTRVNVANLLRDKFKVGRHVRVGVVILNITRFPL